MGRVGLFTEALGEAFLARVRVSGSGAAAREMGVPGFVFYNRMRRDPDLRRRYEAAAAERAATGGRARPAARATVRWSPELGERFLALLARTGNARQAALELGAPNAFANKMKRDPEFRRQALAAAAEADAWLSRSESGFPPRIEYKSLVPPGGGDGDGAPPRRTPPEPPRFAPIEPLDTDADTLGGFLRPGRKAPQSRPQPVLRRNSQGRMQVTLAREGHWTEEIEEDFLRRLRATGNFDACARAVGFQPASVKERMRKWPAFEREVEAALEEADVALTYRLVAHAHALLRRPGEAEEAGIEEAEVPFDPVMAMRILSHIDARKYGRSGKGRGKGPPEKAVQDSVESILRKVEAIERHEAMLKARQERERGGASPPSPGEGGS